LPLWRDQAAPSRFDLQGLPMNYPICGDPLCATCRTRTQRFLRVRNTETPIYARPYRRPWPWQGGRPFFEAEQAEPAVRRPSLSREQFAHMVKRQIRRAA
jgi:hypothetical protein